MEEKTNNLPQSGIEIYVAPDNSIQLQVKLEQDTVWLTQKQLADLFGVKKAAISKHISNIFAIGELDPSMTVSKMETVVNRGFRGVVTDWIEYYNRKQRCCSIWSQKTTLSRTATNVSPQRCSCGSWTEMVFSILQKETNVSQTHRREGRNGQSSGELD